MMRAGAPQLDLRVLFRENELKPTVILLCAAVLLTAHRYFGSMDFAYHTFGPCSSLTASLFMFGTAFFLMGVVPLMIVTLLFKENLRNYGLCLGDWKKGSFIVASLLPAIVILLLYPASRTAEMRAFYPFAREALHSPADLFSLELSRGVLFYTAWEFFFRGFMLFGLRKHVGDWMAICIQMVPQCLWHIGMPTGEIFSSVAGGILFGMMALRTRSIVWPLLLHYAIGVGLDILIVVQQ